MPEVDSHTSGVRRRYGGVVLIPTRRVTSNSYDGVEPELATIHRKGMAVGRVGNTHFKYFFYFFLLLLGEHTLILSNNIIYLDFIPHNALRIAQKEKNMVIALKRKMSNIISK